jgi:hypothetical protein
MAEEQRELPLLTVLAWEARWDRWNAVPQESRRRLVRELARVMIRLADAESRNEHDEDRSPAS